MKFERVATSGELGDFIDLQQGDLLSAQTEFEADLHDGSVFLGVPVLLEDLKQTSLLFGSGNPRLAGFGHEHLAGETGIRVVVSNRTATTWRWTAVASFDRTPITRATPNLGRPEIKRKQYSDDKIIGVANEREVGACAISPISLLP